MDFLTGNYFTHGGSRRGFQRDVRETAWMLSGVSAKVSVDTGAV